MNIGKFYFKILINHERERSHLQSDFFRISLLKKSKISIFIFLGHDQ
jgi:hypothetical protein